MCVKVSDALRVHGSRAGVRSVGVYIFCVLVLLLHAGCTLTDEASNGEEDPRGDRGVYEAEDGDVTVPLQPASPEVQTIQLYRSGDEASLPVVGLGSGESLTLEFDLVGKEGRPLSVFFYHADRTWRYDLQPGEYMGSFSRDDLYSYSSSRGTDISYAHYEYRFPNSDVDFTVSGNYVVRVTERGNEDEVLLERPFFITEDAAELRLNLQAELGRQGLGVQPVARLYPPQLLEEHPFDVRVCFMRDGRPSEIRCVEEPNLIEASFFQFRLPRDQQFRTQPTTRVLDLSLLQESNEIMNVNYQSEPYVVTLERDYARFGPDGREVGASRQSLVGSVVQDLADPDIDGEYVRVLFRYVPVDETRLDGSVVVTGSFNEWQFRDEQRMNWRADEGYYEGEALVKQGVHQYQYRSTGEPTYNSREAQTPTLYTALAYYHDTSLNTDRLLAVNSAYGR